MRYSLPGDWATVEADGTVTLLGRGSVCINTGGEKVFPEEVEEVLKTAGVVDACAGVPDERFGEAVCAIVEPRDGTTIDAGAVIAHVKDHLAHYKAPRRVLVRDAIGRAPNGKVDYKGLTACAGAAGRMTYRELSYETVGDVGVITLDRPEARNALTATTYRELEDAVDDHVAAW